MLKQWTQSSRRETGLVFALHPLGHEDASIRLFSSDVLLIKYAQRFLIICRTTTIIIQDYQLGIKLFNTLLQFQNSKLPQRRIHPQ